MCLISSQRSVVTVHSRFAVHIFLVSQNEYDVGYALDPTNYRPIALTSCVCKVVERMVNNRLVWYLERNKIITPTQSGFRKGRITTDQLVRLEYFLREAFIRKQHATAISLI